METEMTDLFFMKEALREAKKASDKGEIPVGALLVEKGKIVARGYNTREKSKNPLDHAELSLLRRIAEKKKNWRLSQATLYVTLEPCPMCLGALLQARVGRLVYGCTDPKRSAGAGLRPAPTMFPSLEKMCQVTGNNHTVEVLGGVLEKECADLLQNFFKSIR